LPGAVGRNELDARPPRAEHQAGVGSLRTHAFEVAVALAVVVGFFVFGPLTSSVAALAPVPGGPWYWTSPQPSGAALYGVAAFGQHRWAVGSTGTILHSPDAGATWSQQSSGTTVPLDAVAFVDGNNGWAVGGGHFFIFPGVVILRTSDGGQTWQPQIPPPGSGPLHAVTFLDRRRGWAVGSRGTILRTADGGATWNRQTIRGLRAELWCVAFSDRRHGVIGGPRDAYLSTSDGGRTWKRVQLPRWSDGGELRTMVEAVFDREGRGYALLGVRVANYVAGEGVLRLSDGGRRWKLMRGWPKDVEHLGALSLAADGRLHALGVADDEDEDLWRPVFLRSSNGARSWRVERWSSEYLSDLVLAPGGACAVGETILSSSDGRRWQARRSSRHRFLAIDALDDAHYWAIGRAPELLPPWLEGDEEDVELEDWQDEPPADSVISFSSDGVRWQERATLPDCDLNAVEFLDTQRGFATDEASGRLFATRDGGRTWTSRSLLAGFLADVQFIDAQHGWLAGSRSAGLDQYDQQTYEAVVFTTSDGGTTWVRHSRGNDRWLRGLYFLDSSRGWAFGGHLVLRTLDGGITWSEHAVGEEELTSLVDVAFADALHGWALADEGYEWPSPAVYRTSDGGRSWSDVSSPPVFGSQS